MKLSELQAALALQPHARPRFLLPDGDEIPAHFHITEVGHVTKRFIDCGGKLHDRKDTCLLQTWVGEDYEHRLTAGRFAKILQLGAKVLPHEDVDVEVEYDCCVTAQYPIAGAELRGEDIVLQLGEKHTACLARERRAAENECCGRRERREVAASCC